MSYTVLLFNFSSSYSTSRSVVATLPPDSYRDELHPYYSLISVVATLPPDSYRDELHP
ncbi:MAG: hypothetical protein IPO63_02730 [Bacteroidetes bacterium]|nr:hypothetical protein [Bacteroidota bacterium]